MHRCSLRTKPAETHFQVQIDQRDMGPTSVTILPQASFASVAMLQTEVPIAEQKLCPSHTAEHFLSHLGENIRNSHSIPPAFTSATTLSLLHKPATGHSLCVPYSLVLLHVKTDLTLQVVHFQLECSYFLTRF